MVLTTRTAPQRSKHRPGQPYSKRALPWGLGLLVVLGCFGLRTQLYAGDERLAAGIFMFVALAQAWNLIGGYAGYACFGQVAFFGLGGYTTGILITHLRLSFWLALPLSAVVAWVFGVLIGLPLLRLRGHYFAIATLGVAEGLREVVNNLTSLTGGGSGMTIPTVGIHANTAYLGNGGFYMLFLVIAAFAVAVIALVSRSRLGFALRAIHQDEDAAAAMGINTTRTKIVAFSMSGLITGLAGSAYAFQQVSIYPERLFDVQITVLMMIMVVIGGAGTVIGPIVGAIGLQYLSEFLRQHYTNFHTFVLGGIIVLAVVLLPQGAVTFASDAVRARRFSLLDNVRRYRL